MTEEMLGLLEEEHYLAYLCTASMGGIPSARLVGILPSEDMSKIYVGSGRLNKAEKDLSENKNVMIVFYNLSKLKVTGYKLENPFEIKGFQLECKLINTVKDKEDPVFKSVYEITKEAVSEEEAAQTRWVHVFEIKQIYDCSYEGEGKPIAQK